MPQTDEQMLRVYRHDAHKMRGRSHAAGRRSLAGVEVNHDVPYAADADAAALSRPRGKPKQTVESHDTHYRLSLLTGDSAYDPDEFSLRSQEPKLKQLLAVDDADAAHRAWLESDVVSGFNESVCYPYTSLKYHTLLAAALVSLYRDGHEFDELYLCASDDAQIQPHRTIYDGDSFTLWLDASPPYPSARLGSKPWCSWSSVWSRLGQHPIQTDTDKFDMALDAQLRRIQSWSTAIQFIEDYQQWRPE